MLNGVATISFYAADVAAAEQWYEEILGIPAYFHVPGYVEFRIGDFQQELGIIDLRYAPPQGDAPAGAIVYWQVEDVDGSLERLLSAGATAYQPVTERGEGFVTAAVRDPFGNLLGVMANAHYVEIVESLRPGRRPTDGNPGVADR